MSKYIILLTPEEFEQFKTIPRVIIRQSVSEFTFEDGFYSLEVSESIYFVTMMTIRDTNPAYLYLFKRMMDVGKQQDEEFLRKFEYMKKVYQMYDLEFFNQGPV